MTFKKLNEYIGIINEDEAKKYNMKILKVQSNWITGTINGFKYQAQVFNKPSRWGLYSGRISHLKIVRKGCPDWGCTIYHYERSLAGKPTKFGIKLSRQFLKIFPKGGY